MLVGPIFRISTRAWESQRSGQLSKTTETKAFPGRVYHRGGLALLICFIKSPSIKVKIQQQSQTLAFTRLNPAATHTAVYTAACTG